MNAARVCGCSVTRRSPELTSTADAVAVISTRGIAEPGVKATGSCAPNSNSPRSRSAAWLFANDKLPTTDDANTSAAATSAIATPMRRIKAERIMSALTKPSGRAKTIVTRPSHSAGHP